MPDRPAVLRLALLAACLRLMAPGLTIAGERAVLFANAAPLEIQFQLDLKSLCRSMDRSRCVDRPGVISYAGEGGQPVILDVKVKTRGRWNPDTSACQVPALFVYFDQGQTAGTHFEHQAMLPMTTHCQHSQRQYHQYLLHEYLAHRIYNLLTPASLQVRLVRVKYLRNDASVRYTRYGFFIEHFDTLAARIGAEYQPVSGLDPRDTDPDELTMLSVFQYMIGNLDWSVLELHNVAAFRRPSGIMVAVPYDFDYSGLVSAEYAVPPPSLRVRSVRQRKYRGFCRPETDWDSVLARFAAIGPEVFRLVDWAEGLSIGQRRRARDYLAQFYRTVESEDLRREKIIDDCRSLPSPR